MNATALNATGIGPGEATALFFTVVIPEIAQRFFRFFIAPFQYPEMWWLLVHLLLTWVLFELYFDRHRGEELGWSAALANSIVMVFISMELLRTLWGHSSSPLGVLWELFLNLTFEGLASQKNIISILTIFLGLMGLFTAVVNYFHFLPKKLAFLISGHQTVNCLAYFLMVLVYSYKDKNPIPIDALSVIAALLFFGVLGLGLWLLNRRFPSEQIQVKKKSPFRW